jgi:hypothetical protein
MGSPDSKSDNLRRLLLAFLLCTVTITVLGFVYAYVWVFTDRMFSAESQRDILLRLFGLAIVFIYGLTSRRFVQASSKYAGIRDDNGQLLFRAWFGLFAVYIAWVGWFYLGFGDLLLSPVSLWSGFNWLLSADLRYNRRVGRNEAWQVYVPWVVEAFVVFLTVFIPIERAKNKRPDSQTKS